MDKIQTKFEWKLEYEADRISYLARKIKEGFYQKNRFAILPELDNSGDSYVVFPDLEYNSIPQFWDKVYDYDQRTSPEFVGEIMDLIKDVVEIDQNILKQKEKEWFEKSGRFWDIYFSLFPEARRIIGSITIKMTNFGTGGSWSVVDNSDSQDISIYLRRDRDVSCIAEALITIMTRLPGWEDRYTWTESEIFVDTLMQETNLKEIFPDFMPTIESFSDVYKKHRGESRAYLTKIGYPPQNNKLVIDDGVVSLNGKNISKNLTKREISILSALVEQRDKIVSNEKIADIMWGSDEDKYSLWAVNKAVCRLRKKLINEGLPTEALSSVYGRGYVMVI